MAAEKLKLIAKDEAAPVRPKEKEIVAVDFVEFDWIRTEAKRWIKEYRKSTRNQIRRGSWVTSAFYIGRGTTSLQIQEIALPHHGVVRLHRYLDDQFPEYKIRRWSNSLRIYLR